MTNKNLIILFLLSFLISACAGVNIIRDPLTGLMQKEQYSNSLFNVSTNYSQYYQCDREPGVDQAGTFLESDVVDTEGRNCKLLHGEYASTAGSFGTLAGAGVMLGSAALVADGIRDSGDSLSFNNNTSNSKQRTKNLHKKHGKGHHKGRGRGHKFFD